MDPRLPRPTHARADARNRRPRDRPPRSVRGLCAGSGRARLDRGECALDHAVLPCGAGRFPAPLRNKADLARVALRLRRKRPLKNALRRTSRSRRARALRAQVRLSGGGVRRHQSLNRHARGQDGPVDPRPMLVTKDFGALCRLCGTDALFCWRRASLSPGDGCLIRASRWPPSPRRRSYRWPARSLRQGPRSGQS
jgi:hypothetical protein